MPFEVLQREFPKISGVLREMNLRGQTQTKMFWQKPSDVLLLLEIKALGGTDSGQIAAVYRRTSPC